MSLVGIVCYTIVSLISVPKGVSLIKIRNLAAIVLVIMFITGCNTTEIEEPITSIELECKNPILAEKCENHSFNDKKSIKIFEEAINTATEIQGNLNYSAEYSMTISYSNNTTKNYDLSLGTDRTMKGLLVNQENTSQGYEISVDNANQLRDLID